MTALKQKCKIWFIDANRIVIKIQTTENNSVGQFLNELPDKNSFRRREPMQC